VRIKAADTVRDAKSRPGAGCGAPRVDVLALGWAARKSFVMPHLVGINEEERSAARFLLKKTKEKEEETDNGGGEKREIEPALRFFFVHAYQVRHHKRIFVRPAETSTSTRGVAAPAPGRGFCITTVSAA